MRERLYEIIELSRDDGKLDKDDAYNIFSMIIIVASLAPLVTKATNKFLDWIDLITVSVFIIDYIIRWIIADKKLQKGAVSFLIHPFTPMAVLDLLSILPSLGILGQGFKALKVFRLLKTFRVFRVFKAVRYSKNIKIIGNVLKKQRRSLAFVCVLAIGYILVCALVIFNVEPDTFDNFFDAVYWATVSLTTVGYGDIYPISTTGKVIAMISSLFGIAIVALPAGIITAGYMEELNTVKSNQKSTYDSQDTESENN